MASAGELATAIRAGIEPGRIVMTGPGKRDDELVAAVEAGIRAVTVESPGELARLEAIAARRGRRVPVMLRAARTGEAPAETVRLIGDAGAGKFGMDDADLLARRDACGPLTAPRVARPARVRCLERPGRDGARRTRAVDRCGRARPGHP